MLARRHLLQLALAAGLTSSATSCVFGKQAPPSRPLNNDELNRLASMRKHNFSDGRVRVRGTISEQIAITGYLDWRRSLSYLAISNPQQASLVQARPGILAMRPDSRDLAHPPPPDGWRVRPLNLADSEADKNSAAIDNLVAFLFLIARDQPDNADILRNLDTQWVRRDSTGGTDVDVLLGPAVLPETEPSPGASADPRALDSYGGAVGYWLDPQGRLRKLETRLGTGMPTALEFIRDDAEAFRAIDALGGRDIEPREVSDAEADMLSLMRQRNYHARAAQVRVTLPAMPGTLRTASGWLDWQRTISYLSVRDLDDSAKDELVHANAHGVARRAPEGRAPDSPPIPAPAGGWLRSPWGEKTTTDLDVLLIEVLSLGFNQRDDVNRMKTMARRLRFDALDGIPVGVFELPNSLEQQWAPGTARMRYWLDNSGVLRRLEIRTETGGLAQFDITPSSTGPVLPASLG